MSRVKPLEPWLQLCSFWLIERQGIAEACSVYSHGPHIHRRIGDNEELCVHTVVTFVSNTLEVTKNLLMCARYRHTHQLYLTKEYSSKFLGEPRVQSACLNFELRWLYEFYGVLKPLPV